jgi:hypothetical protein
MTTRPRWPAESSCRNNIDDHQNNRVILALTIFGWGTALLSALYSFGVFAIWFVGPRDEERS